MPRATIDRLINMDDTNAKRRFLVAVGALNGYYEVNLKPRRATRTLRQNAYLWGVVYESMRQFMADQGETMTTQDVHEFFRCKFLRRTVLDKRTGEALGSSITSTTKLDTAEFGEYVDKVIAWLAQHLGVVVPEPDEDLR